MSALREAFPLCWPNGFSRTKYPQRARFKGSAFGAARDSLLHQLRLMGATNIILSTNVPLRNDGLPMAARSEPRDTGCAVYFRLKGKDNVLACDKWDKVLHNLHALNLTAEAMRGLNRWGASEILERVFTGFNALPAPAPNSWRSVLGWTEDYRPDMDEVHTQYRQIAQRVHPDKPGGSHEEFTKLQRAYAAAKAELGG